MLWMFRFWTRTWKRSSFSELTTTMETAEYSRPMEQAVSGADDEFTAAGIGIDDAEEGDTDLFALDNARPRMTSDDAEGDCDDGLGE